MNIPDDLSIPAFLRQEDSPARKANRTKIANELRRGAYQRRVESSGQSTISTGHAANLDDAGLALLKEIREGERRKAKRERARLDALPKTQKEGNVSKQKVGKKEAALRKAREPKKAKAEKLSALAKSIETKDVTDISWSEMVGDDLRKNPPPHVAPANKRPPKKTRDAIQAIETVKADAKRKVKPAKTDVSTRPDGLRKDSKQAVMLDLVLREEGATEQAICKKLGWKRCRVTLKRVCDKVGAKLTRNEAGVFHATLPTKKAA